MDFNQYQSATLDTAIYPNVRHNWVYPLVGLLGESGELANKLKKVMRDDNMFITGEKRQEVIDELGDILWYVAMLATEFEVNLLTVAELNVSKLAQRKKNNTIHGAGDKR